MDYSKAHKFYNSEFNLCLTTILIRIYTISNEIVITYKTDMELSLYSTQPHSINRDIFKPKEIQPEKQQTYTPNPHASIEQALQSLFPEQAEENKIARTRKNLGETAKTLSDEQIDCINAEFQFLIDTWLDEYEKDIFSGMTLKEVINKG